MAHQLVEDAGGPFCTRCGLGGNDWDDSCVPLAGEPDQHYIRIAIDVLRQAADDVDPTRFSWPEHIIDRAADFLDRWANERGREARVWAYVTANQAYQRSRAVASAPDPTLKPKSVARKSNERRTAAGQRVGAKFGTTKFGRKRR